VAGVGGYGVAVDLRWFTGGEDQVGQQRLASSPPPGTSGRLTLTVIGIVNTAHHTRISITVENQENDPAVLNLFHNCVLTGGSVTLQADPFRSRWTEEVPPQSSQQGQLVFPGHLPDGAASAQLSFVIVMRLGPIPPGTVMIRPIALTGHSADPARGGSRWRRGQVGGREPRQPLGRL
jgi:hypothetical protein